MYPQNSLVSLMADYHDSDDDDDRVEDNIQNNLNFLNFSSSPGSQNTISNNNNNLNKSNVPAQNASFEDAIDISNNAEKESTNNLVSQIEIDSDVLLPPAPTGTCAIGLQQKITKLYHKIEAGQLDMNQWIQERKDFRNPSIYEKLIGFCNIDELGTNYPPEKFDPSHWPEDSFYDKLALAQNEIMKQKLSNKK